MFIIYTLCNRQHYSSAVARNLIMPIVTDEVFITELEHDFLVRIFFNFVCIYEALQ